MRIPPIHNCEGDLEAENPWCNTAYIRLVQHLIEKCLLFNLDRHDCVEALAKHAHIPPGVTLAVWKGLLRENRDFFRAYFINRDYNASYRDSSDFVGHCRRK